MFFSNRALSSIPNFERCLFFVPSSHGLRCVILSVHILSTPLPQYSTTQARTVSPYPSIIIHVRHVFDLGPIAHELSQTGHICKTRIPSPAEYRSFETIYIPASVVIALEFRIDSITVNSPSRSCAFKHRCARSGAGAALGLGIRSILVHNTNAVVRVRNFTFIQQGGLVQLGGKGGTVTRIQWTWVPHVLQHESGGNQERFFTTGC